MGYRKKWERIKSKSSSVQKEREKRKVAMSSLKKKLEKGNFSKEYHFHQIYHTHAHLDQLVWLVAPCDSSVWLSNIFNSSKLWFYHPYLELHISFRIEIKANIHGLGEDFKHHWVTWVYHLRNLGKFSFQNQLKTSRKFELNQSRQKVSI